jgi:hypothetical protein
MVGKKDLLAKLTYLTTKKIYMYYLIVIFKHIDEITEEKVTNFINTYNNEPRIVYAKLFYRYLKEYSTYQAEKLITKSRMAKIAIQLEIGCYTETINRAKSSEMPIRCTWHVPEFYNLYCERCGTIATLLNPRSSVQIHLIDNIINGIVDPLLIGTKNEDELNSKTLEKEKQIIAKRLNQKVEMKTSSIYQCPRCKEKKCTYHVVQRRALDEAPDTICTCSVCGFTFKA